MTHDPGRLKATILPDGIGPRDFAEALAALAAALGPEHVEGAPDVATCGDPYGFDGGEGHRPSAVVSPGSVEEVRAVLAVARRFRLPLWTVSTGRNLGYGGSAPRTRGSVVMRLSRMNRILAVDAETGTALVEPGVTFLDLHQHLVDNDIPLMLSVPDIGWGSVVGNTLERGFGYTPYGEHAAIQCGLEVVLASGQVVRTGMGAVPGSDAWTRYKGGFGPAVDGLFSQSNLGIVTKMGLWLMPRPAAVVVCMARVASDAALGPLVDALRPLLLDGTIQSNAIVGNATIIASMITDREKWHESPGAMPADAVAAMAKAFGLGAWNARFAVYGPAPIAAARMEVVRAGLAAVPGLDLVERRYAGGVDPKQVHPADRAQLGIPSLDLLRMAGWRGGTPAHSDFSMVGTPTGRCVLDQLDIVRSRIEAAGFDYAGGFTLFPRHTIALSLVSFDAAKPAEREAAGALITALIAAAGAAGYASYRAHLSVMDRVAGQYGYNDGALGALHSTLKGALDPDGLLSAGKQGVWPARRAAPASDQGAS